MIGQRLREFRKIKDIKIVPFSKLIGISPGSLSDIETEKTNPSADTIEAICRHTDINPRWLLIGEGPMYEVTFSVGGVSQPEVRYSLRVDPIRDQIMLLLGDMTDEDRKKVLEFAEFISKRKKGE